MLDNPRSPRVRAVSKLSQKSKRQAAQLFLVEGPQATREALKHRPESVVDLFLTPASAERNTDLVTLAEGAGIDITLASEEVVAALSKRTLRLIAYKVFVGLSQHLGQVGASLMCLLAVLT